MSIVGSETGANSESEDFAVLGERWYLSENVLRLSFAHDVDHLDAGKNRRRAGHRLGTERGPVAASPGTEADQKTPE